MASLTSNDSMFNTLLNQGKSFLNIQSDYKYLVDPHLQLIEQTSSPDLGSTYFNNGKVIENFSQSYTDRYNQLSKEKTPPDDGKVPDQFQDLINQYNIALADVHDGDQWLDPDGRYSTSKEVASDEVYDELYAILEKMNALVSGSSDGSSSTSDGLLVQTTRGQDMKSVAINVGQSGSGQAGQGDQPQLLSARGALNSQYQSLAQQRRAYQDQVDGLNTLIGESQDAKVKARSQYYQLLVWSIVSVTLVAYTTKYALSR